MNLNTYTEEMSKSIWDKAFFMDKIPGAKLIIDFGCADGAMIRMLSTLFPNTTFFGYDCNDTLIDMAWNELGITDSQNVEFFREDSGVWPDGTPILDDGFENMLTAAKKFAPSEICINFSSVLHEVFSSTLSGQPVIRRLIEELEPKYITIRDMYWHETYGANILRYEEAKIRASVEEQYLKEYETAFDFMHSPESITHFLMKYQWKDNGWEDELKENYFSYTIEDFLHKMCRWQYTTVFESHYQLPYLTEKWKKEYGFFVPYAHTHAQFILRRNE